MKKRNLLLLLVVFFASCTPSLSPELILKEIKAINLQEAPITRTMRYKAHYDSKDKKNLFENQPIQPVPVSAKSSNIIITDTLGYIPSGDNTVTPSEGGLDVVIDANIQPGEYYCQTYNNGQMTCERGTMGTHLQKRQLTTLATYSTSDHFASAAYRNEIIIFEILPSGSISEVAAYSTTGQTICVYNENGNLIVARRN